MSRRSSPLTLAALAGGLLLAGPVSAEVAIRSGEHADFSRLVFYFEGPTDWTLGRAGDSYRLVAGSARSARADSPLAHLIEALRKSRGQDWQPADASLGASAPLAGDAALTPPAPQRDWRSWMLWGVLVAGALIVAGFALSLLRNTQPPAG